MKHVLLWLLVALVLTACPATLAPDPTPEPEPKPTIKSFTATPSKLPAGGGSVTLAWDVVDAATLLIDGGVGAVSGISTTVDVTDDKTFTLTATNESGSITKSLTVTVDAPPQETYPLISNSGVFSLESNNGTLCASVDVPVGSTIDLRDAGCDGNPVRYSASVDVENPSGEVLTYTWTLFITDAGEDFQYLATTGASDPLFNLPSIHNEGLGTFDCRIIVQVNASEPSRSKSRSVWQGKCTLNTFTLN